MCRDGIRSCCCCDPEVRFPRLARDAGVRAGLPEMACGVQPTSWQQVELVEVQYKYPERGVGPLELDPGECSLLSVGLQVDDETGI